MKILFWSIAASIPLISFTGRRLQHWFEANLGKNETGWIIVTLLSVTTLFYGIRHLSNWRRMWWRLMIVGILLFSIVHFVPVSEERVHFILFGTLGYLGITLFTPLKGLLICIAFCFGDEVLQWFLPDRVGDLRDVMFNLIASFIGILLALSDRHSR